MGHTNTTPNYNLPQFLGSDKPAWLTDVNNAMSAIDTAIAAAKAAADNAGGAAAALATTVGGHTTQLATLSGTVANQGASIVSQGNAINTISELIGNGEPTTSNKTVIGAINELDADNNVDVSASSVTAGLTIGEIVTLLINQVFPITPTYEQLLPVMTGNTAPAGTASGSLHDASSEYYKCIDGSGTSSDAKELATNSEYVQFTFTTPKYVDHLAVNAIGFSGTAANDVRLDYSVNGTDWINGTAQANPANGVDQVFTQNVGATVKAVRISDATGAGAIKVYKLEAYGTP